MKTTIQLVGIEESNARIDKLVIDALKSVENELDIIGLDLAGKASMRAPVLTGDLRGSWFAISNKRNLLNMDSDKNTDSQRLGLPQANSMEVIVGFAEPYAERQHETLTFRHELGGEAKFLENPFKENTAKYIKGFQEAFRKAVE